MKLCWDRSGIAGLVFVVLMGIWAVWEFTRTPYRMSREWITNGPRGDYRGYSFGTYEYELPPIRRRDSSGDPIYASYRCIYVINIDSPMPDATLEISRLTPSQVDVFDSTVVLLPEFVDWFTGIVAAFAPQREYSRSNGAGL